MNSSEIKESEFVPEDEMMSISTTLVVPPQQTNGLGSGSSSSNKSRINLLIENLNRKVDSESNKKSSALSAAETLLEINSTGKNYKRGVSGNMSYDEDQQSSSSSTNLSASCSPRDLVADMTNVDDDEDVNIDEEKIDYHHDNDETNSLNDEEESKMLKELENDEQDEQDLNELNGNFTSS